MHPDDSSSSSRWGRLLPTGDSLSSTMRFFCSTRWFNVRKQVNPFCQPKDLLIVHFQFVSISWRKFVLAEWHSHAMFLRRSVSLNMKILKWVFSMHGNNYQNHYRKIIGGITKIMIAIFCHFMVKMYLDNTLNSFIDFPRHSGTIKSRFHYFRGPNSKNHDSLVFEPVTKPQNQHYFSLETPGHLNKSRKYLEHLNKYLFVNMKINNSEKGNTNALRCFLFSRLYSLFFRFVISRVSHFYIIFYKGDDRTTIQFA